MLKLLGTRVVVIGAGIGGLVSALELAARGFDVTVLERASAPGGKMREVEVAGARIDAGPTVFTMKWVFDELFDAVGASFDSDVRVKPVSVLARHAWPANERLDLFADIDQSADAIAAFAGPAEARGFRSFCARAKSTYDTLEGPFIRSAQPTPVSLALSAGLKGFGDLFRISPFSTLWTALGEHFRDPRLRQLFGRYATYCGSSPFDAPATLMLVAHVEQQGVWLIEGGMHRLAATLAQLAQARGARIRYGAHVDGIATTSSAVSGVVLADGDTIACDAVIVNGDASAIGRGLLGRAIAKAVPPVKPSARSLSAVTWSMRAETDGFPLARHSVFFSSNYQAEFDDIFKRRRLPGEPTVYVCAEDRDDQGARPGRGAERLLCLVNAPPSGDTHVFSQEEIEQCATRTFGLLERCGLTIRRTAPASVVTTPTDFDAMFPGTGGALYGMASHGWSASFSRPTAKTKVPGLYLAGGSTHPGPGVPMAALSGRLAAATLISDLASTRR